MTGPGLGNSSGDSKKEGLEGLRLMERPLCSLSSQAPPSGSFLPQGLPSQEDNSVPATGYQELGWLPLFPLMCKTKTF